MEAVETSEAAAEAAPTPEQSRKNSGYRRLQRRHHALIEQHEQLKFENAELQVQQEALQADVERLLQQHQRLMENIRSPSPTPWFESANQILAQLAASPEPRALQVMTVTLAGLQQRLAQIIMRVTT